MRALLSIAALLLFPAPATADPAIAAYLRQAPRAEVETVADAVIHCERACGQSGRAAKPFADRCKDTVDRWTMLHGSRTMGGPGSPKARLYEKLLRAQLRVGLYATVQRLSVLEGAAYCDDARQALAVVRDAMSAR